MDTNLSGRKTRIVVVLIIVVSFLILGGYFTARYFKDSKVIALEATPGTKIELGIAGPKGESGQTYIQKIIAQTNSNVKIRVKNGSYLVHFSGPELQDKYQEIVVPETIKLITPVLAYDEQKLSSLLKTEKNSINTVVSSLLGENYKISYEALYDRGEWYAAVLTPNDQINLDEQRIVLQKKQDTWQIAAKPAIVFYIGDFPSIPQNVIRDVNNKP